MKCVRVVGRVLVGAALILYAAQGMLAQEVTASITGTISDQSGGAVADATVTATDTERGTTWTAHSNDSGLYNLLRVPVGTYTLRVEAKGFSSVVREAFTLVLNQTARIDVALKVGDVSVTVEVSGDAPVLKTDSTQVDTVINAATNDALPLATRNYVELTLLAPGSVTVNPDGFNTGNNTDFGSERPYINGNRDQSNNFLLDGMDNNQVSDNLLGYTPSPDAIQEFNLITSNAPAEFGNFQGGIVSATIKSGTNNFHGDVWEFFRNDVLNANSWSNNFASGGPAPKDKLRWNMFGGTLGGPIFKNKLFFFVDYQGQRFDHPSSTVQTTVFTNAERAGDFSELLASGIQIHNPCQTGSVAQGNCVAYASKATRADFAGNIIPSNMISPVAQALFNSSLYLPTINGGTTNNAQYTKGSNLNADQGDLKIDYQVSNNDRISGRFTRSYQNNPTTNSFLLLGNGYSQAPIWNITGDWVHSFSPSIQNDFRIGWNHVTTNSGTTFDPSVGEFGTALGIGNGNPTGVPGLLAIQVGGGIADIGAGESTASFDDHVWQFEDSVSVTRGRHNFKFGGQYWKQVIKTFYAGNSGELGHLIFNSNFTASSATGSPTGGFGGADFFLGLPSELNRGNSTGQTWQQSSNVFGFYGQDNWRITDRLTLNLGLRYEAHTPWVEEHDKQVNIQLGTGAVLFAGQDGNSRALYNGVYGGKALQPRIGFAWSPAMLGGHTVVRGAFTISSYMEGTGTNLRLPLNPPFTPAEFDIQYNSLPLPLRTSTDGIPAVPAPTLDCPNYQCFAGALLRIWDPNVQPSMSDQWNLTVQHQFWKDMTFQIGYVGQRGTHLMVPFNYAQRVLNSDGSTSPSPFLAGNPQLAAIASDKASGTQSNGNMTYHAMQAVLQKHMSKGLQFQVAYTFSKCMSDSTGYYGAWVRTGSASAYFQNTYDQKDEWAPCYYDASHVVSTYAIYELPVGRGRMFGTDMNKFADAAVGGWSVSGIMTSSTGFPLSVFPSANTTGVDSRGPRPDCLGTTSAQGKIDATGAQGFQWFTNPGVFQNSATGTFGTCAPQLGWLRGPGYINFDLSLQKDFHITERFKLQFRSDFLNAFNHVNLNGPNTTLGSPTLGLINTAQSPRNIQFALKLYY